jgi:formate hydrogenlyase transcriptional activator
VFPVRVPSLRERPEDIPLLVRHFVEQCARRMNKKIETISTETLKQMRQYHWPGNIRELQNVIERAVILSAGPVLKVPLSEFQSRAVPAAIEGNGNSDRNPEPTAGQDIWNVLEETERKHILSVLSQTNWVVAGPNGAAVRLGMKRSTLQLRMRKLGISRENSQPVS